MAEISKISAKLEIDTTDLNKVLQQAKELEESLQHSSDLLDKLTSNNQSIHLSIDGKEFAEITSAALQKVEAKANRLNGITGR